MTMGEQRVAGSRPERGERATVLGPLTNAMFCLQLTDGREVVAHAALDLRMAFTRLLPGDQVLIEVSPFDPGKARICRRLATTQPSQHPKAHTNPATATPPTATPQTREPS